MLVEDELASPVRAPHASHDPVLPGRIAETYDLKRIRGLIALLDKDVEDRSRRDFFVGVSQVTRPARNRKIDNRAEGAA